MLTQIIVEEEQKGQNLLPISFLRQLISLYGDSMQWLVPRYLDHAMSTFARNQEQMRKSLQDAFGGLFPFGPLEEMGKQNLALFEKTMKMFSPFPARVAPASRATSRPRKRPGEATPRRAAPAHQHAAAAGRASSATRRNRADRSALVRAGGRALRRPIDTAHGGSRVGTPK